MPQSSSIIGQFDRPVIVKKKTQTTDTFGKPTVTLSEFRRAWVSMEPHSNTEQFASDRQTVFSTFKVQMHYMSGITNDMVLFTRDTFESFDIKSVINIERKMFIEMVVQKVIT
jgi:SPP1 family predicted phage head-tail adaptor